MESETKVDLDAIATAVADLISGKTAPSADAKTELGKIRERHGQRAYDLLKASAGKITDDTIKALFAIWGAKDMDASRMLLMDTCKEKKIKLNALKTPWGDFPVLPGVPSHTLALSCIVAHPGVVYAKPLGPLLNIEIKTPQAEKDITETFGEWFTQNHVRANFQLVKEDSESEPPVAEV